MHILKIAVLWGVCVPVALAFVCSRPTPAPPEGLIHDLGILDPHPPGVSTAILVQVIEVERQEWPTPKDCDCPILPPAYTTMRVLKSWKGPVSAGDVLHTPKIHTPKGNSFIAGCPPWDVQSEDRGKEFVILDADVDSGEIYVNRWEVWPAERSQALMATLDQAVEDLMSTDKANYASRLQRLEKEEAAVKDLETKIQAAESNPSWAHRYLLKYAEYHASEEEIADLVNQREWHEQNTRHLRSMLEKHATPPPNSTSRP